jgi:hypothetical protein
MNGWILYLDRSINDCRLGLFTSDAKTDLNFPAIFAIAIPLLKYLEKKL